MTARSTTRRAGIRTVAATADKLYFACGSDNAFAEEGGVSTTVTEGGRLAWADGTGPPEVNRIHHPKELLDEDLDTDDDTEDDADG